MKYTVEKGISLTSGKTFKWGKKDFSENSHLGEPEKPEIYRNTWYLKKRLIEYVNNYIEYKINAKKERKSYQQ